MDDLSTGDEGATPHCGVFPLDILRPKLIKDVEEES